MVTIVFSYPHTSELYVVLGFVGYAPSGPNNQDIYLNNVYFLGTHKEWKEFTERNKEYKLMKCGFLIKYEQVVYIQVDPSV